MSVGALITWPLTTGVTQGRYYCSSIGSLSVCGKFAASVFPTVVKYILKLFAMSVLSVQGTPLDVINVSVTVVFCFCFSVFRLLFPMFFPIILCMLNFSLK